MLATFLTFWKIGSHDLSEWDESRNGVNAYEMYHNGDFINLHYAHDLDTWNAKPPLMIWLIVLCYKIFGFNEFALRLPAVISTILFFIVFYKLVSLMENKIAAFVSCLILISCKAVIGFHVGINGDFDAMLMLFLTLSAFYYIRYIDYNERKAIYLTALFTALAFYTKGTAALLFVPGFVLYAWLRGKGKYLFNNRHTWLACLLFTAIAATWTILILVYGKSSAHPVYNNSKNALEVMLIDDTYRRLTSNSFDILQPHVQPDNFFFFHVLDTRLNIWNYLFYLSVLIGMIHLYRHRKAIFAYLSKHDNSAALFSVCILLPMMIIMTLAVNKHDWYLAPFFGFIAFLTARGVLYVYHRWKPFYLLFAAVFLFSLVRNFLHINSLPETLHEAQKQNKTLLKNSSGIVLKDLPKQSVFLYIEWTGLPITIVKNAVGISTYKAQMFIGNKSFINDSVKSKGSVQAYFDEYYAVKIE